MTPKEARLLLSDREWQVAKLANMGKKIKDIAKEMGLAEGTIKMQLYRARNKLGKNFRNVNLFSSGESLPLHNLKNGKCSEKKCGKELFEEDMRTGRNSMAFKRYAMGEVVLNGEAMLAYAISGLDDKKYLFKKRAEILKTMSATNRYKVVTLSKLMLTPSVMSVIDYFKLRVIKTDFPGLLEGDTTNYTYLCRTEKEYNALTSAIIGLPNIHYDNAAHKVTIEYKNPVYVEHIRIKQHIAGGFEFLAHGKYGVSGKVFEIGAELMQNNLYTINLQIGNAAQVGYEFCNM